MTVAVDTICLVDDDEIYQFTTQKYIQARQLARQILSFWDGEEAIDYLQAHSGQPDSLPDKILLDLSMPVMDGWGFLEEFVRLKPRLGKPIEVYIVSSSVDIRDLDRARKISEVSDFIVKPINDLKLDQIFTEMLN